jgi:hypothetical protein
MRHAGEIVWPYIEGEVYMLDQTTRLIKCADEWVILQEEGAFLYPTVFLTKQAARELVRVLVRVLADV